RGQIARQHRRREHVPAPAAIEEGSTDELRERLVGARSGDPPARGERRLACGEGDGGEQPRGAVREGARAREGRVAREGYGAEGGAEPAGAAAARRPRRGDARPVVDAERSAQRGEAALVERAELARVGAALGLAIRREDDELGLLRLRAAAAVE